MCPSPDRTSDYVILCGRKDFTEIIRFRIFRMGDYPGLSRLVYCNDKREARSIG
jgi:hypothetical protein